MKKAVQRDKVVSLKMTEPAYQKLKELAEGMDLMTSTMAYLIVRKYLAEHVDPDMSPSDFNLL
jgi:hypothetical protein